MVGERSAAPPARPWPRPPAVRPSARPPQIDGAPSGRGGSRLSPVRVPPRRPDVLVKGSGRADVALTVDGQRQLRQRSSGGPEQEAPTLSGGAPGTAAEARFCCQSCRTSDTSSFSLSLRRASSSASRSRWSARRPGSSSVMPADVPVTATVNPNVRGRGG
jgi:hypothetical protein